MNVHLLIPAYNVADHLEELIRRSLNQLPADRLVVVDDGSTDGSGELARKLGIGTLSMSQNQGKGAALRLGFKYLRERGVDWVLTIDGDLQHDPDYIPKFIDCAEQTQSDVVIGEREFRIGGGMPLDRRFSNWCTSALLSRLAGTTIRDSQCGYRLFRLQMLDNLKFHCVKYDFETEYLLALAARGAKFGWVKIPTTYGDSHSSIRRAPDTLRFLRTVVRHIGRKY